MIKSKFFLSFVFLLYSCSPDAGNSEAKNIFTISKVNDDFKINYNTNADSYCINSFDTRPNNLLEILDIKKNVFTKKSIKNQKIKEFLVTNGGFSEVSILIGVGVLDLPKNTEYLDTYYSIRVAKCSELFSKEMINYDVYQIGF